MKAIIRKQIDKYNEPMVTSSSTPPTSSPPSPPSSPSTPTISSMTPTSASSSSPPSQSSPITKKRKIIPNPLNITDADNIKKSIIRDEKIGKGGFGSVTLNHLSLVEKKQDAEHYKEELQTYIALYDKCKQLADKRFKNIFPDIYMYDDNEHVIYMEYLTILEDLKGDEKDIISDCYPTILLTIMTFNHFMNLSHQDIKPKNIGISKDGTIKLFDFGLTVKLGNVSTNRTSYYYPFHLVNLENGKVIPKSTQTSMILYVLLNKDVFSCSYYDIFSFGVMLFDAVFNAHPFSNVSVKEPASYDKYMISYVKFPEKLHMLSDNTNINNMFMQLLYSRAGDTIDGDSILATLRNMRTA